MLHRIQNLKLQLADSEITEQSLENTGRFTRNGGVPIDELPNFYRVHLLSKPGPGSEIHTELWLPEDWNGIFVGLGNGGMAGSICYQSMAEYVKQGYAIANTDMGTSRGRDSGINNPDVWKDFGWRATHVMTVSSKQLIRHHYGKAQDYAYFVGNSTGGQQALAQAQRFPEDYDGIIAGVPANNRTFLHTYFLWNHRHLRSNHGSPLFTKQEIEAVNTAAVNYFQHIGDGQPGDGFITFPKADTDCIQELIDWIQKECSSLSQTQLSALKAVYTGPVNPYTGERIYNGMPAGSEIYGCGIDDCQQQESPHFYLFNWAFGAEYDGTAFDFDKDLETLNQKLAADLNANNPDLSAFKQHSGKLIMFSGSADPCVPFPDAINYYNRVLDTMGGYSNVSPFFRYFLFPGKDHGLSGRGVNVIWADENSAKELDALRRWREHGTAPDMLLGVGYHNAAPAEGIKFIRKIKPVGSGSVDISKLCPPVCSEQYLTQKF